MRTPVLPPRQLDYLLFQYDQPPHPPAGRAGYPRASTRSPAGRKLDERRQRALTRYYLAAGVGGIAVGVHTTQFAIRDPEHGLYEPVLALAAETIGIEMAARPRPFARIAGVIGRTSQAVREAELAARLGFDAVLLSLAAWQGDSDEGMLAHCRAVGEVLPLFGFYLQPAVGGRVLSYEFWRKFVENPAVVAIKIAPFSRYQTLDVVRAVSEARRDDIALLHRERRQHRGGSALPIPRGRR